MAKFGIGQPVRRVGGPAFPHRARAATSTTSPCRGSATACWCCRRTRMRASRRSTPRRPRRRRACCWCSPARTRRPTGSACLMAAMMPEDVGGPKGHRARRPLLAVDKVRAVGDRVAFVVAETLAQAQDAAELIEVDYETLPAVACVEDAAKAGAPAVWDDCPRQRRLRARVRQQGRDRRRLRQGAHHVSLRLENNRLAPMSMEPRAAIGDYNAADDTYTLYTTSQNPHGIALADRAHVRSAGEPGARDLARRRRRLRHEGRRATPRTGWCCGRRRSSAGR